MRENDTDHVVSDPRLRRMFYLMSAEEAVKDYLSTSAGGRKSWVEAILEAYDDTPDAGACGELEGRSDLLDEVFQSESSEEIRAHIKPMVDAARAEFEAELDAVMLEGGGD